MYFRFVTVFFLYQTECRLRNICTGIQRHTWIFKREIWIRGQTVDNFKIKGDSVHAGIPTSSLQMMAAPLCKSDSTWSLVSKCYTRNIKQMMEVPLCIHKSTGHMVKMCCKRNLKHKSLYNYEDSNCPYIKPVHDLCVVFVSFL